MSRPPVHQYLLFLINGGLLGLLSWALQLGIYWLMNGSSDRHYATASFLACVPVVFLNLSIQRCLIFGTHGPLFRFMVAQLFMMAFVSLLSPECRSLIELVATSGHGDQLGFALASLVGSIPSFLLNKFWGFRVTLVPTHSASTNQ